VNLSFVEFSQHIRLELFAQPLRVIVFVFIILLFIG
jgi:hypothetical protein